MSTRLRPTRDGWIALAGALGLAAVASVSGNNLVYLVAAPLWAALLLAVPLGWWNLRGVRVRRILPAELYAGRDAPGRLLVQCGRRGLAAADLELVDEGTGALAHVRQVPAGETRQALVRWRFGERGPARLLAIVVRSTFPFGLAEHTVRLPLPAEVLVYPRPHPSGSLARVGSGIGIDDDRRTGGTGDFVGLRPYRDGDSPRRVHWPTTARLGQVVVVDRASERAPAIEVVVQAASTGATWERELSRAAGEVQRALGQGLRVGLRLPALDRSNPVVMPAGIGPAWRRTLLDALALLPRLEP